MYKVHKETIKKEKNNIIFKISVVTIFFVIVSFLLMNSTDLNLDKEEQNMAISFMIVLILFIIFLFAAIKEIILPLVLDLKKISKKLKDYQYLEKNGILLKNVTCEIRKKIELYNGRCIYIVNAQPVLPSGEILKLEQDIIGGLNLINERKNIDVLIDFNDYNKFYMNFDIEEF